MPTPPGPPERAGFWSQPFGRVLRWFILAAVVLFGARRVEVPSLLAAAWFFESDPPTWAVVLAVLVGGGLFMGLLSFGANLFAVLVAWIAPNPHVAVSVVGVLYVLGQVINAVTLWGDVPWWVLLNKALVTLALVYALVLAYAHADEL